MKIAYIREMDAFDTMNGKEDIDWCRCYQADDYSENYFVRADGNILSVKVDGKDDETDQAMDHLASCVNPDYDPDWGMAEEQAESRMHRCGCLSCPWADECDAMHGESLGSIYQVTDDDGDEYFVLETDDDRWEGRELEELRRIDDSDVASPLIPDDFGEPSYESLAFMERYLPDEFAKIPRIDLFSVDMQDGKGEQTIYWDNHDKLIHSSECEAPISPVEQKTLREAKGAAYEHYLHCAPAGSIRWILK